MIDPKSTYYDPSTPAMNECSAKGSYVPDCYKNSDFISSVSCHIEQINLASKKPDFDDLKRVIEWQLPGFDNPGDFCDTIVSVLACPDHKEGFRAVGSHCFNPACPTCYDKYWANREASRVTDRMLEAELQYKDLGFGIGACKHIVISPPQKEAIELIKTSVGYKKLRSVTTNLLKSVGVLGGVLIFHPYRKHHVVDHSPCENKNCKRDHVWEISPHFHFVGYGYLMDSKTFFDRSGGWVYKNMGVRKSVFGTVHYLLTHCGLGYVADERVFHSVTWFGIFSNHNILVRLKVKDFDNILCPICNKNVHKFYVGNFAMSSDRKDILNENWQDEGEFQVSRIIKCYSVKPPANMLGLLYLQDLIIVGLYPDMEKPNLDPGGD